MGLFESATSRESLAAGWRDVLQRVDVESQLSVAVRRFARRAESALDQLASELQEGLYRPGSLFSMQIPKASLGVPRSLDSRLMREDQDHGGDVPGVFPVHSGQYVPGRQRPGAGPRSPVQGALIRLATSRRASDPLAARPTGEPVKISVYAGGQR